MGRNCGSLDNRGWISRSDYCFLNWWALWLCLLGLPMRNWLRPFRLRVGSCFIAFKAMGRLPSFITTWAIVLGYVSVVAFEAVALPTVFEYLVPNYSMGYMYTIAGWDVNFTWVAVGVIGSILIAMDKLPWN